MYFPDLDFPVVKKAEKSNTILELIPQKKTKVKFKGKKNNRKVYGMCV